MCMCVVGSVEKTGVGRWKTWLDRGVNYNGTVIVI